MAAPCAVENEYSQLRDRLGDLEAISETNKNCYFCVLAQIRQKIKRFDVKLGVFGEYS
jgi:hypothetical protein